MTAHRKEFSTEPQMALAAALPQLTTAREHALLGEYPSAMVYYEGVLAQITK